MRTYCVMVVLLSGSVTTCVTRYFPAAVTVNVGLAVVDDDNVPPEVVHEWVTGVDESGSIRIELLPSIGITSDPDDGNQPA